MPIAEAKTTRDLVASPAESGRTSLVSSSACVALYRQLGFLNIIFLATNLVSWGQSIPVGTPRGRQPVSVRHKFRVHPSPPPFTHLKPEPLDAAYKPFTPQDRFRWFTANTVDPANLAGGIFEAALGTVPDRPKEYGPHWGGFNQRYGIGMSRTATENALEAGAGFIAREDPRYFRMPDQPFRARARNVVRLALTSRDGKGSFNPAYARFTAIFGANFLSNCWSVRTEANTHDALLRSAEDFGGVLASNAFEEFWPDVKRHFFHYSN